MRYTRVKYRNYAQHRSVDIAITGNVVGLVGSNGSGKTNFITGMRDGATGEFSRPKERLITRGETEGSMEFEIVLPDSRLVEIKRELHSPKATLRVTGDESVSGASKVNTRLLELLGVEKSILTNVVFVGQREIEQLLFARSGVKDRLAQKFFGIDTANHLESVLAKRANTIAFDSGDRRLPELRSRRQALLESIAQKDESLRAFGIPWDQNTLDAKERELYGASSLASKIEMHRLIAAAITRLNGEIASLEESVSTQRKSLSAVDVNQIDKLYTLHQQWEQRHAQIGFADDAVVRATTAFNEVGVSPYSLEEIAALDKQLEPIDKRRQELDHDIGAQRKLIEGTLATSVCPTCHQAVDISSRQKIETEIASMVSELQQLDQQRRPIAADRSTKARAYNAWLQKYNVALSTLESAKRSREAMGSRADFTPNREQFAAMRRSYDAMAQQLSSREEALNKLRGDLADSNKQLEAFGQQQFMDANGQYLPVPDVQVLNLAVAAQKQLMKDVREKQAALATDQQSLREVELQILSLEKVEKSNRALVRFQRSVTTLREVFHPDGAPKTLVSRNTKRLEARVNQYLDMLQAPFRAVAKEGLDFEYIFSDGVATGDDLSVGQQVDMSWAFRLAATETFCASVGFMTMDEPTAPLDKDTKARFGELVERLKGMAVTHGMQFFISTHDDELVRCCDQVIRFGT